MKYSGQRASATACGRDGVQTLFPKTISAQSGKDFVVDTDEGKRLRSWPVLGLIWLTGAIADRLWFGLDRSVPAWDQAEYLTGSLTYWQALQHPQLLSGEWWASFWALSSKVPPLTYIITAALLNLFGAGPDPATLVNLLFSAILLVAVWGLGAKLFNRQVGLWAAGLCLLFPGLYLVRLDFLLDYPLTAVVALSFYCLTVWRDVGGALTPRAQRRGWLWASGFGVCFGLALLVKQTALFFLLVPVLWVGVGNLWARRWERVAQLVWSLFLSLLVCGPWYGTNWLLILTGSKRATVDAAIAEGDPPLHTLDAWTFYWKDLPYAVSWPLLLVPVVGLLLYWLRSAKQKKEKSGLKWLAVFWVGSYLLCSVNINKDSRYVLPYLPAVSLFLAYGLTHYPRRWGQYVRWGTAGTAIVLMLLNLWPVGGIFAHRLTQFFSPRAQHQAYLGSEWPHRQVIAEIIQTQPYLDSTLGVLPSTPTINQHNINHYGALANFQVYGRQVGVNLKQVPQDVRSLSWFLSKTGDQGSVPKQAQTATVSAVEGGSDFQLSKTWPLPDGSTLKLYRRKVLPVEVLPNHSQIPKSRPSPTAVQLERVTVPKQTPPGVPVPVTYEWSGPWPQLQEGLVLLTWRDSTGKHRWLHDRAIGMGTLHGGGPPANLSARVKERMAMLPPADVPAGTYTLEATYLNRHTGKSYAIPVPAVSLKIAPAAPAAPAPELDLLTQLRNLAAALPKGAKALPPVFEEIGRINQYDPIQDYTAQAELALQYRLRQEPQNLEWAYALALARVLQRDAAGAISALTRVVELDSQNPYAYAYLAFVYLYDWNPKAAEAALKPAFIMLPNQPEIKALDAVAALMQGKLIKAFQAFKDAKIL
jgi:4-amino-4-deoxy-L-arabinose transferase-like glycosyltransferase